MSNLIPKVIHYCWFGRNPLPKSALKCIESWKKFLPDYEIKEWNEDNFDVNIIPYTKEAYEAKKYAFVSDYARFWILYNYGGIYFDTDVEIIKPIYDILQKGAFMGIEVESKQNKAPLINPGLGIAAPSGLGFYNNVLKHYSTLHFIDANGEPNTITVVTHTSNLLNNEGLKASNGIQEIANIWIYPQDYFNPLNDNTAELKITNNTRSIHWYTKTWEKKRNPIVSWTTRRIHRYFGESSLNWLNKLLNRK